MPTTLKPQRHQTLPVAQPRAKSPPAPNLTPPDRPSNIGAFAAPRDAFGLTGGDAHRTAPDPARVGSPTNIGSMPLGTEGDKVSVLSTRAAFDARANSGTGAGVAGMPEVKFLLDRKTGQLYFLPKTIPFHYYFARDVLKVNKPFEEFNKETYLNPNRRYVAGTLTGYDNYVGPTGKRGGYGVSFWSTDVLRAPLLIETMKAVTRGLPFATEKLFYHPGGQTQERLLDKDSGADATALKRAGIPILSNAELSKHFDFSALNEGVSFGTLRIVKGTGADTVLSRRDVAIYADEIPADTPPLAGIVTPKPQTYLSHVALKARQDNTPYAYARDLLKDPAVRALEGKLVQFHVTATGYTIKPATKAQADAYFEKGRPTRDQVLRPNLSVKALTALDAIDFGDARAFGSKTANVAELRALERSGALNVSGPGEPKVIAPDGFGIPASWYKTYMATAKYDAKQTLDQRLAVMLADPKFKSDPVARASMLEDFRDHVEDAAMPPVLARSLAALEKKFAAKFPGQDMRIRSSSSSEDLEGFSGAGLFDSFTFRYSNRTEPNRSLGDRLQKVFASVWNDRAVEEFEYYRIDPKSVAMAELVMPNSDDEIANGVVRWGGAIPGWDTMSVNAQVGESLVTNPEGGATPDAFIVGNYGFNGEAEIQYEQHSNQKLPPGRTTVLTDGEVRALFKAMKVVQEHFKKLYGGDAGFNIESEFKITRDGKLLIKQARPWVA